MELLDSSIDPTATALRWLNRWIPTSTQLLARVGYLDRSGVALLEDTLRRMLDAGGEVHLVVDCRDDSPRHTDLGWIVETFASYGERATVTVVRAPTRLHAKAFLLTDAHGARRALVGSANLTGAGLARNVEAGIAIDEAEGSDVLDKIEDAFRRAREQPDALPIDVTSLATLTTSGSRFGGENVRLGDLLLPVLDQIELAGSQGDVRTGVATGFIDLDRLLNGLQAGQMIIIAGRPGLGKSVLGLDFARSCSIRQNLHSLVISLEMSRVEIMERLIAAEARVPLHHLRSGQLSDVDWSKLAGRMSELSEGPLHINDTCGPSIRAVSAAARRAKQEHDLRLVVVDNVQLMRSDRRVENRQNEIADISRGLKQLARELDIALVVISQLNRSAEGRFDKRPQLSDLRDSGQLEQDADVVILLHRDDYYDKESPRAGEADIIVAKQRSGPTDTVTVAAQLHLARFVDMAIV